MLALAQEGDLSRTENSHPSYILQISTTTVAERRSTFTVFVKALTDETITLDVAMSDAVNKMKSQLEVEEGTARPAAIDIQWTADRRK